MFNLDKVRLKHMISSLAKHKRQLQTSSKCCSEACTNVPSLGVTILGNCKESLSKGLCLVSELLYFLHPANSNTDLSHVFQTAVSAVNIIGPTQARQFLGFS